MPAVGRAIQSLCLVMGVTWVGSFTRAAAQLGVTRSALSQTARTLERRIDQKLLNRTTRSVAPTEAGEQLFRTIDPRFAEIEAPCTGRRQRICCELLFR
jgi:DNA-binding transcriptional LysR family regulator